MILDYKEKMDGGSYLSRKAPALKGVDAPLRQSVLLHGDNAEILRSLLQNHGMGGKVDLVYIDPPFSTNSVFRIGSNRTATVSSHLNDDIAYVDLLSGADFLEFIRERLILLRELMSEQASIYLHIDYKIGHYIKVLMDEVFGIENFRSDISRIKCNPKNFSRKGYGNIKDMILFYSKGPDFIWNEPRVPMSEEDINRLYSKVDSHGRRYTTVPVHAPGETAKGATSEPWRGMMPPKGRHWRSSPDELDRLDQAGLIEWSKNGNPRRINYADDAILRGKKMQDIWEFKDSAYPQYPTQKNIDLLKMIIQASSHPDSMVMDCFCGSGTTLVAAQELGRQWIGIDSSVAAIGIASQRLKESAFVSASIQENRSRSGRS